MVFYCTNCWKEIDENTQICPYCGADQVELDNEDFVTKLIRSLNHPEPTTPILVANILADIKAVEAVPALLTKLKVEKDPFIIEALVKALLTLNPQTKNEIKKLIEPNIPITIKDIFDN
ncbi:zinc-ribbon domain-containing protein [Melioribacteraceae bacterium 4301-Me]|uniref:zinc-ribbon domain-containing protein n=1 Tax=Pyranulibacter aquaticus TaxID=3163344 RepID=UPI003598BD97